MENHIHPAKEGKKPHRERKASGSASRTNRIHPLSGSSDLYKLQRYFGMHKDTCNLPG